MNFPVIISILIFSLVIGLAAGSMLSIIIAPIFSVVRLCRYIPLINERICEKAQRDGHMIHATLIKRKGYYKRNYHTTSNEIEHSTEEYRTEYTYEYDCNGKKRRYKVDSKDEFPETITLYYIKNPKKACIPGQLGYSEKYLIKHYFIISLILSAIATVAIMIFLLIAVY